MMHSREVSSEESELDPESQAHERSPRILVVDDEPMNRRILSDILNASGNTTICVSSGAECLEVCATEEIDTILLDVMMPGMDGFETCKRLKQRPEMEAVPVIFVTALDDRSNCLQGIQVGATDFIGKPIDVQNLRLRVKNAVSSKLLHDRVVADFNKLQELEAMKDDLTNMIVHDLRSPLMGISGYLELLGMYSGEMTDETRECVTIAAGEAAWMTNMISSILDVRAMEEGRLPLQPQLCDVGGAVSRSVTALGPRAKGLTIVQAANLGQLHVYADSQLLERLLINLISNATKFGSSRIEISACPVDDQTLRITVTDDGCGIPEESQQKVFGKFVSSRSSTTPSTGLGLSFCKVAVEAQGGTIGLSSQLGTGTSVWIELPRNAVATSAESGLPS